MKICVKLDHYSNVFCFWHTMKLKVVDASERYPCTALRVQYRLPAEPVIERKRQHRAQSSGMIAELYTRLQGGEGGSLR